MTDASQDRVSVEELGALARRVLTEQTKRREALEVGASAASEKMWRTAGELGWFLLTIPVDQDGLGQDFSVLSALYTELGRALSPVPLLNAMLAADALTSATNEEASELLQSIGSGEAVFAVQIPGAKPVGARRDGTGITLTGELAAVAFPANATHLLLAIDIDNQPGLMAASLEEFGVRPIVRETWDRTREIASVDLNGVRVGASALIRSGNVAEERLRSTQAHFDLAIACDSIGGAEMILTETVDYTKTRRQFGREIGSFQALKHRCADMKTWLESARALTNEAVARYAAGEIESPFPASAKYYACEIFRRIAMDAVQIHGGIGFTWEQDCHLFLKRALLNEQLGGAPSDYQDRLFEPLSDLVSQRQVSGADGR
jgi:alkylation response protein AidB-like acyl-CoA dehydrogenase